MKGVVQRFHSVLLFEDEHLSYYQGLELPQAPPIFPNRPSPRLQSGPPRPPRLQPMSPVF